MKSLLEKLNQMQAVCDGATTGPWYVKDCALLCNHNGDKRFPQDVVSHSGNKDFIAQSRTDWPATIEALKVAVKMLSSIKNANSPQAWAYEDAQEALAKMTKLLSPDGSVKGGK